MILNGNAVKSIRPDVVDEVSRRSASPSSLSEFLLSVSRRRLSQACVPSMRAHVKTDQLWVFHPVELTNAFHRRCKQTNDLLVPACGPEMGSDTVNCWNVHLTPAFNDTHNGRWVGHERVWKSVLGRRGTLRPKRPCFTGLATIVVSLRSQYHLAEYYSGPMSSWVRGIERPRPLTAERKHLCIAGGRRCPTHQTLLVRTAACDCCSTCLPRLLCLCICGRLVSCDFIVSEGIASACFQSWRGGDPGAYLEVGVLQTMTMFLTPLVELVGALIAYILYRDTVCPRYLDTVGGVFLLWGFLEG